mmetsp:Transcript_27192/g.30085  ORF Transcript_27192/g.30085 Transcript_27192/m.30085 type:complete len:953 (+) Transcript_27192:147-3005(+)
MPSSKHNKSSHNIILFLFFATFPLNCNGFSLRMGLLKVGVPKNWNDSKKDLRYIRKAGVSQFVSTYNRVKDLEGDELLWGDEIEYGIFQLDDDSKKVRIALRGREVMDELNRKEKLNEGKTEGCNFVPEYGAWMIEAIPRRPYTGYTSDLLRVERNMRLRRTRMLTALRKNEVAPSMSTFPLLGAMGEDGSVPPVKTGGPVTLSDYIGDGIINPHPRFGTLSANIRQRRGEKVSIRVPLFRDTNTPEYQDYKSLAGNTDGCCGSDRQQLWRYGKGDASEEKYGKDFVEVGCSTSSRDEKIQDSNGDMTTLQKWLVDVQCSGCLGLFYRSAPNVIVPDADWPRNGDIVVGYEIQDVPGWIRLQNGYYLPIRSEDKKVEFLHKVSTTTNPSNGEMRRIGSGTPLFRMAEEEEKKIALLIEKLSIVTPTDTTHHKESENVSKSLSFEKKDENFRAAIHMDAMAFGMGCCCLQITFQAKDMDESRFMYDQLAVMAPIMMALTASTPLLKGRIADTDTRWGVISESVDDRTRAERGRDDSNAPYSEYAGNGRRRIYKSRYDCISTYIYQGVFSSGSNDDNNDGLANRILNTYNDIPVPIEQNTYEALRKAGIDPALSQHVAHLFIRDPLVIFNGAVKEVDDDVQTEHWESIQSTNWQTVRWKPPPPRNSPNDPHIGWRTEFRSMEIQMTDFENAAFTAFTVLLTRVIKIFDLNLYIPLSRVDSNMQRAHSRNASVKGKFFFRRHLAPLEESDDGYGVKYNSMFSRAVNGENSSVQSSHKNTNETDRNGISRKRRTAPFASGSDEENSYEEMTMSEIMCGKGDYFPGLIPLVHAYLDYINCDSITRKRLNTYLDFIRKRAIGELVTPATWIRNYVRTHKAYNRDSVVTDEIAYDLVKACTDIGLGNMHVPELLGDVKIDPVKEEDAYEVKLDSARAQNECILELLQRYKKRDSFKATA